MSAMVHQSPGSDSYFLQCDLKHSSSSLGESIIQYMMITDGKTSWEIQGKRLYHHESPFSPIALTTTRRQRRGDPAISQAVRGALTNFSWFIFADLNEQSLSRIIPYAMKHTLEALFQYPKPSEKYTIRITPQNSTDPHQLLMEIEWNEETHGKDVMPRIHFLLDQSQDSSQLIIDTMSKMLHEYKKLENSVVLLQHACNRAQQSVASAHTVIEAFAAKKEVKDGEYAVKSLVLIAAKQDKILQLQEEVDAQRAGVTKRDFEMILSQE